MADALQDTLDDGSLLRAATDRLGAAETMWTIECEADGTPSWLTLVGVLPAAGQPARVEAGARHFLPEQPCAGLSLGSPGVPLLIPAVHEEPRLDAQAREPWRAAGALSMIVMTLRGRVVGLLTIQWTRQVALGPREQRVYSSFAAARSRRRRPRLLRSRFTGGAAW